MYRLETAFSYHMPSATMVARTAVILALLGCVVTSHAALTTPDIVNGINALTSKSMALQAPAKTITIVNGPLIVIGQGPLPQVIAGFSDIVSTATNFIASFQGTQPISNAGDAAAIADAFRTFVRVHQELLNILIGKAGLLQTLPIVGAPMATALRSVESVVDTIAFSLIDTLEPVPASSTSVRNDAQSLDGTLTVAINAYEGIQINNGRKLLRERAVIAAA